MLLMMRTLTPAADDVVSNVILGIHGGIGVDKKDMTPEHDKEVRAGLTAALQAGRAMLLTHGGSSLDAVEAAIRVMEDLPVFNAGKGAVFTHAGTNELDASIMDGKTKKAGSVAGVMTIKNPITRNSISNNTGLGIDLGNDGVTPNDFQDLDGGPNEFQNYPLLSGATTSTGTSGEIFSAPTYLLPARKMATSAAS